MSYPDLDTPLIESAIAARQTLYDAIAQTDTNIHNLTIAQRTCTAERSRLIDRAARGEAVPEGTSAELEAAIRSNETGLLRQQEILARQKSFIAEAEKAVIAARGLAHGLRVTHALRELRDGNADRHAAQMALNRANGRLDQAKQVIFEAFGAGHPMPSSLPKGAMAPAEFHRAMWADLSERALRRAWGHLADEAFGPAETPAAPAAA